MSTSPTLPRSRPKLDVEIARAVAQRLLFESPGCDGARVLAGCPVMLLGVRGYYRDTFKRKGVNDVGVYDDAAFLITPDTVLAFNWNCDPSKIGWNKDLGKFYAQLVTGVWPFRQGPHKGRPKLFRQPSDEDAEQLELAKLFTDARAEGEFTVRRVHSDETGELETGYFAINIHDSTDGTTGSWGCQTAPRNQMFELRDFAYAAMATHAQRVLPYILTEEVLS
jgi:lysozyme